jgi:hypothetical protein
MPGQGQKQTPFSGAVKGENFVHCTLLLEQDLNLHSEIGEGKAKEILTQLTSPLA